MTDSDAPTDTASAEPPERVTEPAEPDGPDPAGKLRAEAARYRKRAQDAEASRDALSAEIEGYRRAEVERIAGTRLADPADLWLTVELSDLIGDAGIDHDRVTEAIEAAVSQRPHWAKATPPPSQQPSQDLRVSSSRPAGVGATWDRLLRR